MWSRTQNYPLDNNDDQISIINRFFDFMNNTRRLNNRIIEQNDNLAEMGYELTVAFIYSSRNNNLNTNSTRNSNTTSTSNNNSMPTRSNTNTTTNTSSSTRNNNTRRRSRTNRSISSRYTTMRSDWRNLQRNNARNLWQRNVRPRNINNSNINTNNVSRNPIQSPLSNIIPMFGPLSFQPTNNNALEQLFQQSLQSVSIRPTTEQIERATEERIFNQIVQPINDTCPITRNRFNDNDTVLQILECRHCFNPSSLRRWFETSVRCPICRYDIREYNPLNVVHNPYRNNENDIENPITQRQDTEIQTESVQDEDDNVTEATQDTQDTQDTTSSQDMARELVMNELDNINNDPQITEEQRNLANIISQSMNNPTTNEELIQTETSIDSNGNLNLTYQFGLNLPPSPP